MLKAAEDKNKPYFLILDEMNLSYVERYFADFLSAMESHESISTVRLLPTVTDSTKVEVRVVEKIVREPVIVENREVVRDSIVFRKQRLRRLRTHR